MIKKLRVTIEGKTYEVEVEILEQTGGAPAEPKAPLYPTSPMQAPSSVAAGAPTPSPAPPTAAAPVSSEPGIIPSPLSGNVVAVNIQKGQTVKEGDLLLTLEAMKMNTFIFADRSGSVQELLVEVGSVVGEGQPLVKIG